MTKLFELLVNHEARGDFTDGVFLKEAANHGLFHTYASSGSRPAERPIDVPLHTIASGGGKNAQSFIFWAQDVLASITHHSGSLTCRVFAASPQLAEQRCNDLLKQYSLESTDDELRAPVTFWFNTPHGPDSATRTLDVVSWPDIRGNYTEPVQEDLDQLVSLYPPNIPGRIVFWHGHPGTGKTYALRSLAWEWRKWCSVHYIIDPDSLLSQNSAYLAHLLIHGEATSSFDEAVMLSDRSSGILPLHERWRLFVLEDAGELVASDARQDVGQALSRLLNIADGLLGQGLRVLILVSTNEDIGRIHEAALRPGRRLGLTEFTELSEREIREWFERHEHSPLPVRGRLSEMYDALSTGIAPKPTGTTTPGRHVGFVPEDLT